MKIAIENEEVVRKGLFSTKRMRLREIVRVQVLAGLQGKIQREPFHLWDVRYVRSLALSSEAGDLILDCNHVGFQQLVARLTNDGWRIAEALPASCEKADFLVADWEDALRGPERAGGDSDVAFAGAVVSEKTNK